VNILLERLKGGDIRSDGEANDVAADVLNHPVLFEQLFAGLTDPDGLVRGRSAHALEQVSRSKPELFLPHVDQLVSQATDDPLPMVRWHLAMIFANLSIYCDHAEALVSALFPMLEDNSVFVQSWAVSSLTILAKQCPGYRAEAIERIRKLRLTAGKAVQPRIRNALDVLENEVDLPKHWVKSEHLGQA
jgi:HEAT repeat protein